MDRNDMRRAFTLFAAQVLWKLWHLVYAAFLLSAAGLVFSGHLGLAIGIAILGWVIDHFLGQWLMRLPLWR